MRDNNFYTLSVKHRIQETPDAVTLKLDIPSELRASFLNFQAGQYLNIKCVLNGKEHRRAYSISSSPFENELAFTVKAVENGTVSKYLCEKIKEGDKLEVMPPQGNFSPKVQAENRKSYYLFAAGSGITPVFSILKTLLENQPQSSVFLLYGSRNEESIIFKNALDQLAKRCEGQFILQYILSQPKKEKASGLGGFFGAKKSTWQGMTGRIDRRTTDLFMNENPPRYLDAECFVCGPDNMIQTVEQVLVARGVPNAQIHREYFTTATQEGAPKLSTGGEKRVIAKYQGKKYEVQVPSGKTILQALLTENKDFPYSCMAGSCSTCMAKVVQGEIKMDVCHALDDDEVKDGFLLTCQAHPLTDVVEINFDA